MRPTPLEVTIVESDMFPASGTVLKPSFSCSSRLNSNSLFNDSPSNKKTTKIYAFYPDMVNVFLFFRHIIFPVLLIYTLTEFYS